MNTLAIKHLSQSLMLTKQQQAIVVGLLLGDGHAETSNGGRTFRLKVEHSFRQKAYVDWLYQKLNNFVLTPPQIKNRVVDGKARPKYWFSTISTIVLSDYGRLFYPTGVKIVPKAIRELVTPLSLAVWFMDDGSLKSKLHRARIINTQAFDEKSLQRLQRMLLNKFGIKTVLRKQPEGKQIYILSDTVERFLNLIKPYVVNSMAYKIKLG